jgi:Arc/MetJ-type ribon-helix-helix transcriptional regulator
MVTVAGDISEEHRARIESLVKSGKFRNISHFVDEAIKSLILDLDKKEGEQHDNKESKSKI